MRLDWGVRVPNRFGYWAAALGEVFLPAFERNRRDRARTHEIESFGTVLLVLRRAGGGVSRKGAQKHAQKHEGEHEYVHSFCCIVCTIGRRL